MPETPVAGAVGQGRPSGETRAEHTARPVANQADRPDVLRCPKCGGDCLHHISVTIFQRKEDEPDVQRIVVDDAGCRVEIIANTGSGNPSVQRGGLSIRFWCEGCDGEPILRVAQHRGQSLLSWAEVAAPADRVPA